MASGEDIVDVLLHGPRCAHPPAWHLIDDHIGPEEFLDFDLSVVATVDEGVLHIETGTVQMRQRGIVQGLVETTVRVGELFAAIEQKDLFHAGPRVI